VERRFETADWWIAGGGFVLLFSSVLPWWTLRIPGNPGLSFDGKDFTSTGIVPVALLLVVAMLTVVIKTETVRLPLWLVHPYLTTLVVLVAVVLVGVRFFWSGFEGDDGVTRSFGMYLAMAAAMASLAGCVMALRGSPDTDDDDMEHLDG
jgi:hypothetical protein